MTIKNIYQRINEVMKEVSYIQKGTKKVANQYTYTSHDQVTGALREHLIKHGIAVIPTILEMVQNGNMCIAKVQVNFVNIDDPKDLVSVTFAGHGIDAGDKGPGKAVSYACKYALLKTFCLETGDDPDHDQEVVHKEVHPAAPKKSPQSKIVASDDDIANFYEKHKKEKDRLKEYIDVVQKNRNLTEQEVISSIAGDYDNKMASFRKWANP